MKRRTVAVLNVNFISYSAPTVKLDTFKEADKMSELNQNIWMSELNVNILYFTKISLSKAILCIQITNTLTKASFDGEPIQPSDCWFKILWFALYTNIFIYPKCALPWCLN